MGWKNCKSHKPEEESQTISSGQVAVGELMNSWQLWWPAQNLHELKLANSPAMGKGRNHKPLPLMEELLTAGGF